MKIISLILILVLVQGVSAYQIKYYSVEGKANFSGINQTYFKGVKTINIIGYSNPRFAAIYHIGGIIDCYDGCYINDLKHELAHHCQWMRHDSLYNLTYHKGKFIGCMKEID